MCFSTVDLGGLGQHFLTYPPLGLEKSDVVGEPIHEMHCDVMWMEGFMLKPWESVGTLQLPGGGSDQGQSKGHWRHSDWWLVDGGN